MVGCVQYVAGNNNFVVQFEDRYKSRMSYSLMLCVFDKEEVG